jgi:two-component system, LuxR family, response regulator FixJ
MNMESTVFVVDDDQAVRRSLEMLLMAIGLHAKTYASCEEFLTQFDPSQTGCLILDIRLPGMDGLELLSILSKRDCCLPAIIVTGHGDVPVTVEAFKKGAVDFIQKPYREHDLLFSIKKAIQKSEIESLKAVQRKDLVDKINQLSPRERQIAGLIAEGHSDKEIAVQLGISQRAIAHHRLALIDKLGVPNAIKLATLIESLWVTV